MSPYIQKTGHRFPYPSNCALSKLNFTIQTNYRTKGDLTNKIFTSTPDIVNIQEKIKNAEYFIKKNYVKPNNMALKHVTRSLQRIDNMETPTNFRKDDYSIKE